MHASVWSFRKFPTNAWTRRHDSERLKTRGISTTVASVAAPLARPRPPDHRLESGASRSLAVDEHSVGPRAQVPSEDGYESGADVRLCTLFAQTASASGEPPAAEEPERDLRPVHR